MPFDLTKIRELPPHARRILKTHSSSGFPLGTTSACAENTPFRIRNNRHLGNYLRMRGEYGDIVSTITSFTELPPHARRIPAAPERPAVKMGTTSACAENTAPCSSTVSNTWNYLRMRGEYKSAWVASCIRRELPPHARRIRYQVFGYAGSGGTTSACAENTVQPFLLPSYPGNYLRMRGEYRRSASTRFPREELPPHARRIQRIAASTPR